jgi:hypothetical protein
MVLSHDHTASVQSQHEPIMLHVLARPEAHEDETEQGKYGCDQCHLSRVECHGSLGEGGPIRTYGSKF